MATIAIKLDPAKLTNPDADIRYTIPERLQGATGGRVQDDGYDYLPDGAMAIFLLAKSPDDVEAVVALLSQEKIAGNDILSAAIIGVDSGSGFSVVHPEGYSGPFDLGEG